MVLSWVPALPLVGFLINGLWYLFGQSRAGQRAAGAKVTGVLAAGAIFGAFVVSVFLFNELLARPVHDRVIEESLFNWMQLGDLRLAFALRLDALSVLFILVITGVGTLIHLYSIGYMGHDETPGKFFAYLNLFCFAMLILVLGASLPVLFLGWEGVGLCSYLLIGYWYEDGEKASAGKKAFVVNRVGDFGFILGMFVFFSLFGTMDFATLKEVVGSRAAAGFSATELSWITAGCLLVFLGCTGKSAQIPLFVWLPDAMAGPTPVSALIHAATMVTAGIYLVSRLSFLYVLSPTALGVIAWVGALTAFFAATIALVQKDIKKVLAYSTVSQLGYMFLACGVAAFGAGVFHVITHAFFKALLFLGAGSVIHGMHHEQDVWKMGGLGTKMKTTYVTFLVGWLAICGIFPFAGFWSKDEVLWVALSSAHGSLFLWGLGVLTAVMTAFYMTRLVSLTFWGTSRYHEDAHHTVHESPASMLIPLLVLAVASVVGGFIGVPHMSWLHHWLEPVIAGMPVSAEINPGLEWVLMAASVALACVGIVLGWRIYKDLRVPEALEGKNKTIHSILENKWFVDDVYDRAFVRPIERASRWIWTYIDVGVIDRAVLAFGKFSEWSGQSARGIQTGSIQIYAGLFLIGLVLTVGYLLYGMV